MARAHLFPGWAEPRLKVPAAEMFARTGGAAPPLLSIAAERARHCTQAVADLRGQRTIPVGPVQPNT